MNSLTTLLIAGVSLLLPAVGVAQADPRPAVIARVQTGKPNPVRALYMRSFHDAMRELGHVDGRTYVVDMHYVARDPKRMRAQIGEVVRGHPAVIMTNGTPVTLAASELAGRIPIVMATVGDPVGAGIVDSLSRPGGNVTGVSNLTGELYVKRLDIIRRILPEMRSIGYVWTPINRVQVAGLEALRGIAGGMGIEVKDASVRTRSDVVAALAALKGDGVSAIIVPPSIHRLGGDAFPEFAYRERMPLIYDQRRRAETGAGLFSYGANMTALYRRAAEYVHRILAGAEPADLPIEQPTQFELVVNLEVASALQIAVPSSVLLHADAVIQ